MSGALKSALFAAGRAASEAGAALDSLGLRALSVAAVKEPFSRHRPVSNLFGRHPAVENDVFVAPSATVVGRVVLQARASVGYGAVLRGDNAEVLVGRCSHVGDRAVLSTAAAVEGHVEPVLSVGNNVVIGAGALLQSCTVEDGAAIGAGAIALEGSLVEKAAQLAPGAVLHSGRRVPAGQLWAGNPAVFVRDLSKAELANAEGAAEAAAENAAMHAAAYPPPSAEAVRNALA
jgi:carbonic anhydrase/acetyltransferase-like protein (isoleucine patch superfamily)